MKIVNKPIANTLLPETSISDSSIQKSIQLYWPQEKWSCPKAGLAWANMEMKGSQPHGQRPLDIISSFYLPLCCCISVIKHQTALTLVFIFLIFTF